MITLKTGSSLKLIRLSFIYFRGPLLEISKSYVHGRYLPKYNVKLPTSEMKPAVTTE